MKVSPVYLIAGAAVAGALAWVAYKGAKGAGAALVAGAVDLADGIVGETVQTAGEVIGIPRTDTTKCQQDIAAGRTWDASFSCPAATFLKYVWS